MLWVHLDSSALIRIACRLIRPAVCCARLVTSPPGQDVHRPRGRISGAMVEFIVANWKTIKQNHPDIKTFPEIIMKASETWSSLPVKDKEKYMCDEKAECEEDTKAYTPSPGDLDLIRELLDHHKERRAEARRLVTRLLDVLAEYPCPLEPIPNARLFYLIRNKDTKTTRWEFLLDPEKENYRKMCEEGKKLHKEVFGKWVQAMVLSDNTDFITMEEIDREMRRLGMPQSFASPVGNFVKTQVSSSSTPVQHITDHMKTWESLSAQEKEGFTEKAKTQTVEYKEEMEKWKSDMERQGNMFVWTALKLQKEKEIRKTQQDSRSYTGELKKMLKMAQQQELSELMSDVHLNKRKRRKRHKSTESDVMV